MPDVRGLAGADCHDAIVIGAGPGGAMAAWEFCQAGWNVLVIDKSDFPRHKACGGALSLRAIQSIPFDISAVVERKIDWIASNRSAKSDRFSLVPARSGVVTIRFNLDDYLLDRAIACGAAFVGGSRVTRLSLDGDHVRVSTADKDYRAASVILACGADIGLDREGYLRASPVHAAFALEGIIDLPVQAMAGIANVMEFDFRYPDLGYSWMFPVARGINVGVASFDFGRSRVFRRMMGERFNAFAAATGGQLTGIRGAPLGVGGLDYLPQGRVLYVGDAAGLTSENTGEGISSAVISGRLCARAFIESARTMLPAADIYMVSLKGLRRWLMQQRQRGAAVYGA